MRSRVPGRLARSKTPFTEAELQPLTELFLSVANEAGYPKSTPLEYMKIQTASIVASIASLRARNTALKEVRRRRGGIHQ